MAHVIETIRNLPIEEAVTELMSAHSAITGSVIAAQTTIDDPLSWGAKMKRLEVTLPTSFSLIGKKREKLVELINILATTERTIGALQWFESEFPDSIVRECHPSTSDDPEGNDIVIINRVPAMRPDQNQSAQDF